MKLDKHDVVVQAIELAKKSEFKATAIKVELEAQLNRGNHQTNTCGIQSCDGNGYTCLECDGAWEGERCDNGCDEGRLTCDECGGSNEYETDEGDTVECPDCEYEGWNYCEDCEDGWYANCEYCNEGFVECNSSHDGTQTSGKNWAEVSVCHGHMMTELKKIGLAERVDEITRLSHGQRTKWRPVAPLKYAEFYNDGSVDSEFTFTLDIRNAEDIFLLPKIVQIFIDMGMEINGELIVNGAGMHMAWLNSEDCNYPTESNDRVRFDNFRKSMHLLLPAMYFLGTSTDRSRGLNFRLPDIGRNNHRTAIDYRGGALEYRVFDTCYHDADTILDNVVVMSRTLRYWTREYTRNYMSKITERVKFGVEGSDKLERLYLTDKHIDLLNKGLEKLKPSYYTVAQLKAQRKFSTTKSKIRSQEKVRKQEATIEYKEYDNRFEWATVVRKNRQLAELLERKIQDTPAVELESKPDEIMAEVEQEVEKRIEEHKSTKLSLEAYVEGKLNEFYNRDVGQFELVA